MYPNVFGIEHIVYTIIFIALFIFTLLFIKRKCTTEEQRRKVFMILGGVLLFSVILNRVSLVIRHDSIPHLLPSSFCGVTSFALGISLIFIKDKSHALFHVLVYIGFIGGLLVTVLPTFINQATSIFYLPTISGLVHHSLTLVIVLLLIITKEFKPSLKKWWYLPLGLSVYMTWGMFLIQVLDIHDAMNIYTALIEDSIFTWYFVGALMMILQVTFLITWEKLLDKNKLT